MNCLKPLIALLLIFTLTSCGDDNDDSSSVSAPPTEREEDSTDREDGPTDSENENTTYAPENFETRLDHNLKVSGVKCEGGEDPNPDDSSDERCKRGEWLVTLDNENVCNSDGACTEIFVYPVIADLDKVERRSNDDFTYYRIDPEETLSEDERRIVNKVWIRTAPNGETVVVKRESVP